jgi:hypothetical protein
MPVALTRVRHWRIFDMRFFETRIFTVRLRSLLDDDEYRSLQFALLLRPTLGAIVRGSGGLRKVRWAVAGRGKRGGIRVIYVWIAREAAFYMLYAYAKNTRGDLTPEQLRTLGSLVRKEFK